MNLSKCLYFLSLLFPSFGTAIGDVSTYLYATILFVWFLAGAFLFKGE